MGMGDSSLDQHGFSVTPGRAHVRFGAIGEAWGLFKQQWGPWLVTALFVVIGNGAVAGFVFSLLGEKAPIGPGGFRLDVPPEGTLLEALLSAIVTGFSPGGMFRRACRQVRGERVGVMDLFDVTDVLSELAIGTTLLTLALFIAGAFCGIPAFILAGLLMFTLPLIVDARLSASEAIRTSWRALKGQWLAATLFHFIATVIAGLGVMCCFVGLYFTLPLYCLSVAVLYREFFLSKGSLGATKPSAPDPYF